MEKGKKPFQSQLTRNHAKIRNHKKNCQFKVRLKPRKIHQAKTKGCPRINTCGTSDPVKAQSFAESLQEKLDAQPTTSTLDAKWSHLCDAIYNSSMAAFGKKEGKNADWFEVCWEEMQPVTEAKRKKLCWLTSRTLPQAHTTPFEQLGARPSRPPPLCQ